MLSFIPMHFAFRVYGTRTAQGIGMQGSRRLWNNALRGSLYLGLTLLAAGQPAPSDPLEALRAEMQQLRVTLKEMNDQLAGTRRESQDLRRELEAVRKQL